MTAKNYLLILLIFLYFVSRLLFLTSVPVFNDESTYLRVAAHQIKEPDHSPYSLKVGKEPLLPYLFGAAGEFSGNYLIGGRIISIIFGFFTFLGITLFTKELFGKKAGLFSGFLYILAPFTIFFDRLALLDSGVSTISAWSLFLTYLLFKEKKWIFSALLGFVLGIGIWIKATSMFFVFLPLMAYPFYYFFDKSKKEEKNYVFLMLLLPLGITSIFYLLLRSHPFYSDYSQIIGQYTYRISEVFSFPIVSWIQNSISISEWLFFYLTPIVLILSLLFIYQYRNEIHKYYLIILWFVLPLVYEILAGKMLTSRHVLLLTIPLIALSGAYLSKISNKVILYLILGIFSVISLFYIFILYLNPQKLPDFYIHKAKSDMMQYFYGFSSGYGVSESIEYLKNLSKDRNIIVIVRNDFGNPEDAVIGHLYYNTNTQVIPLPSVDQDGFKENIETILTNAGETPVYFVSRGNYFAGADKYFKEEKIFKKPNDEEFVGVYKLGI
ncbi:MAG: hypothetical protein US96_C0011G0020 [Candidatus Woesebacteria bacterium GW2011_GWB1_38_5b]|uniref:Glycosyltransferase RgtA/B/C/D-like domain-containing protein n=1 Tax=Candidatus Woesebacteria bacterium GW2011_GWB1_38_5b TaxID=1618569 RepID=A0A0G0K987_9BACT|nr:MAG: hypothetical protein US96_C0011G0020 [Candidatus Woesebacteria bacterium GW2011_GWB1_38_5b]OGH47349.1 MAG: hypothetical protein A3A51_01085 [Candidatus Levybacteria bacterium RIFCSPLOWO2_01_FULL_39_10]